MSAVIFFSVLITLAVGVWVVAGIGFWYGRELLKRQQILVRALLPYLKKVEQDRATMSALHIDRDEPIAKYQEVTLPDAIHIDFRDTKEG